MFPAGFQTARLTLRPIALPDVQPIFEAYAHYPEVARFLTWRPHTRIEQTQAYVERCIEAAFCRTYVLNGRADRKLLGAFDLRHLGPSRFGFGYVLARSSWGRGLMTEALTEVACWALSEPNIWRIGDVCDVENRASVRVMEKAGLVCEGTLRRWVIHPSVCPEPRDCFSYAKVR